MVAVERFLSKTVVTLLSHLCHTNYRANNTESGKYPEKIRKLDSPFEQAAPILVEINPSQSLALSAQTFAHLILEFVRFGEKTVPPFH